MRYRTVKPKHEKQKEKQNKEIYDHIKTEEKKRKQERISYLEVIADHMLLPPDVMAGVPFITMNGRSVLCVENHRKILEYTEERIRILAKPSPVCVEGKNLKIAYYSKAELKITGLIKSISYL